VRSISGQGGSKGVIIFSGPPWPGDPGLNLQSEKGKAKAYQVEQVIAASKKLEGVQDEGGEVN